MEEKQLHLLGFFAGLASSALQGHETLQECAAEEQACPLWLSLAQP